jgi:hypothetical protein
VVDSSFWVTARPPELRRLVAHSLFGMTRKQLENIWRTLDEYQDSLVPIIDGALSQLDDYTK